MNHAPSSPAPPGLMLLQAGHDTELRAAPPSSRRSSAGANEIPRDAGKRQGRWATFHDNGNKKSEGGYLDGEMHGPFQLFHQNGRMREEGQYVRGRAHGRWTKWDEAGNKVKEVVFHHGVKVSS